MHLLLISGSTRAGSTNSAVLALAAAVAPPSISTEVFQGLSALPAFNPDADHDPLFPPVLRLRTALARADAVLVCTPEYAGSLPGSLKNLLDWTVGGIEFNGLPVGAINASSMAAPTAASGAHRELRTVLGYVQARIVEDAWIRMPVSRSMVDGDGRINDADVTRCVLGVIDVLRSAALSD